MFFFGGYSTILPYLVYLSIVWICILIGVKGDIWKVFHSEKTSEQLLISDDNEAYYNIAYDISSHYKETDNPEKRVIRFIGLPGNHSQRRNKQIQNHSTCTFNHYSFHLESQHLRGPPEILI